MPLALTVLGSLMLVFACLRLVWIAWALRSGSFRWSGWSGKKTTATPQAEPLRYWSGIAIGVVNFAVYSGAGVYLITAAMHPAG
jgi:heme A synthase